MGKYSNCIHSRKLDVYNNMDHFILIRLSYLLDVYNNMEHSRQVILSAGCLQQHGSPHHGEFSSGYLICWMSTTTWITSSWRILVRLSYLHDVYNNVDHLIMENSRQVILSAGCLQQHGSPHHGEFSLDYLICWMSTTTWITSSWSILVRLSYLQDVYKNMDHLIKEYSRQVILSAGCLQQYGSPHHGVFSSGYLICWMSTTTWITSSWSILVRLSYLLDVYNNMDHLIMEYSRQIILSAGCLQQHGSPHHGTFSSGYLICRMSTRTWITSSWSILVRLSYLQDVYNNMDHLIMEHSRQVILSAGCLQQYGSPHHGVFSSDYLICRMFTTTWITSSWNILVRFVVRVQDVVGRLTTRVTTVPSVQDVWLVSSHFTSLRLIRGETIMTR